MKRKFIYLILMMFFCAFAQAQTTFTVDYGTYSLTFSYANESTDCTLTKFSTTTSEEIDIDIPSEVVNEGKTFSVITIGESAFELIPDLSNNNPTPSLRSVIIPATVNNIGIRAFYNCNLLEKVTIKGNGVSIEENAFKENAPTTDTKITQMIFMGTHPTITQNSLPETAYDGTLQLFVPEDEVDDYNTWKNTYNNTYDRDLDLEIHPFISDKVIYYGNYSLIYSCIDPSINVENLKVKLGTVPTTECSLTIPETVNIDGVDYNVTAIETGAFPKVGDNYLNFTSVLCTAATPPTTGDDCFSGIDASTPLYVGVTFTGSIGNWVTNIHNDYSDDNTIWKTTFSKINPASYRKDYNEDYSLDYTITNLDNKHCAVTSSIINNTTTHITIDNTITIAEGTKTETIYKVTAIGNDAFNKDLASDNDIVGVTIPSYVSSIGNNAFDGLNKLSQLIFMGDTPTITPESLPGGAYNGYLQLFVPADKVDDYNTWKDNYNTSYDPDLNLGIHPFISNEVINYGKYSLVFNYADESYENLKVRLGDKKPTAGNKCSLTIPEIVNIDGVDYNVTAIEAGAFSDVSCANFTSVLCTAATPPETGNNCFSGINDNTPLYVGCSYENGNLVTTNYSSIETWNTKFTIKPASKKELYNSIYSLVYTISDLDNKHCAISSVEIKIAQGENLTLHIVAYVNISDDNYAVTAIGDNAFKANSGNLTFSNFTYDLNTSLSYIGSEAIAFENNINLTLPESVTKLANNAFKNANFNSITVYSKSITLGENILYDSDVIYIPEMYKGNYNSWTVGTKNLNKIYMPCLVNDGTDEAVGTWTSTPTSADKIVVKGQCILPAGTTTCNTYYLLKDASLKLDVDLVDNNNNNNNAQLVLNSNGNRPITVEKTINKFEDPEVSDGWYTISSPLKDDITLSSDVSNITSGTYDLYRYDEPSYTWQNSKTGENSPGFQVIEPGRGYLYANAANTTLSFTGEVNTAKVTYAHALTASNNTLSGFHLIGNPFTHNIYIGDGCAISPNNLAEGYYTLEGGDAWNVNPINFSTPIKPGQGFLVKTNAEIQNFTINKTNAVPTQTKSSVSMLHISLSNDKYEDVAYVSFNEGIGLDKISHINENAPMLYIPVNGTDYAIAIQDKDVKEIPVCAKIKTMGEYTIDVKTMACKFDNIILVDRLTGIKTNMLTDSYTFMATSNDNPNRFIIRLTDENIENEDENFIFINNNELIINNISGNAIIDIYDVMGRRVYNNNGQDDVHIVSTDGYSAGVYVIRLMDEKGLRTQKVIID